MSTTNLNAINKFLKFEKPVQTHRFGLLTQPPKTKDIGSILDVLFPPLRYQQDNRTVVQKVSRERARKKDILSLGEHLDQELRTCDSADISINEDKEQLYANFFDELVRQETIDCPERGLFLKRAKDEIYMTVGGNHALFRSTYAYGLRKNITVDKEVTELEDLTAKLEAEHAELSRELKQLQQHHDETVKRVTDEVKKQMEDFMVQEEIMEESNQLLEQQLERIVDPRLDT